MTCTSRPQVWGQGTLQRKPGMIRQTDYPSRKSIKAKSHRDPRATRHINRWTPIQRRNFLVSRLQDCWRPTSWESLMTLHYEDFPLTDEYCQFIAYKCCEFVENLEENARERSHPCFPLTSGQLEDRDWDRNRCWMVTASRAKTLLGLSTPNSRSAYLRTNMWRMEPRIVTPAMEYGIESERLAKVDYLKEVKKICPDSEVVETGLWAHHDFPQLGCSPDGFVVGDIGFRLLEIKCPYILKDHDVNLFEEVLNKAQLGRFFLKKSDDGDVCFKRNHEYYLQIQMCLGIHSAKVCDLFVWSKHGYLTVPVVFDPHVWESMKNRLLQIHFSLILPEYFAMRTVRGLEPMVLPDRYLPPRYGQNRDEDQ